MTPETRFIPHALRAINDGVVSVIGMTNLHVRKSPLSRRLAQRARAQIKALEQMLRRVIVLMAFAMHKQIVLPPALPPRIRVLCGPPAPAPAKPAAPPWPPRLPSLPAMSGACHDFDFSKFQPSAARRPVSIKKLMSRIIVLQRILKNPAPKAKWLARRYAKMKARKTVPPLPPPAPAPRRASAELSLIAGAIPLEMRRALADWYDTS